MTQPTLSHALKRLEKNLGADLFYRSKQGLQLTKAGEKLSQSVKHLTQEWNLVIHALKRSEAEPEGRFTLGCHPAVAQYLFPSFLKSTLAKYPRLEISLVHNLSRKITEEVISWEVDIGVVVNPMAHPDLVIRPLCSDKMAFWCSKNTDHVRDTIIYDPELHQSKVLLKKMLTVHPGFRRTIFSSDMNVISSLVGNGCGIGILPERVLKLNEGHPVRLFDARAPFVEDKICLVFRKELQKNIGAKVIIKAIQSGALNL